MSCPSVKTARQSGSVCVQERKPSYSAQLKISKSDASGGLITVFSLEKRLSSACLTVENGAKWGKRIKFEQEKPSMVGRKW